MARRRIQTRGRRNKARMEWLSQRYNVPKGTLTSVKNEVKRLKRLKYADEVMQTNG